MSRGSGNVVAPRRTARRGRPKHASSAEAEFRAVFEHAAIGIAVVDMTGHPVRMNPALVEILGYTAEELTAMPFADFTHPDDVEADLALFAELLEGERDSYQMEKRYVRKDGATIWGLLSVSVIKDASGRPAYAIGMIKDVTQRKLAEDDARRTTELLRRSSDQRRDLLTRLVATQDEERRRLAEDLHDDPIQKLTAATVRLGHLRRLVDDGEAARLLDEVEATTSAAIARLRALQFDLRPRSLDRPAGLREALRLRLEDLHHASGIGVDLVADVSRPIPPATRTTAYRIIVEALSNVQKHSGARRVRVMLATAAEGLSAVVEDDGVGFDAAAEGRARHIGLASMRERAEAAGGAWWAASAPGRGTKVHLWLPDEDAPDGS